MTALNIRRGLFRVWLVISVLFAIGVGFLAYPEVKRQFDAQAVGQLTERGAILLLPLHCGSIRGEAGKDYLAPGPREKKTDPLGEGYPSDTCWMQIDKYRELYPEDRDVPEKEVSRRIYTKMGHPPNDLPNPWVTTAWWSVVALGISLAVLAIGVALAWALAGFNTDAVTQLLSSGYRFGQYQRKGVRHTAWTGEQPRISNPAAGEGSSVHRHGAGMRANNDATKRNRSMSRLAAWLGLVQPFQGPLSPRSRVLRSAIFAFIGLALVLLLTAMYEISSPVPAKGPKRPGIPNTWLLLMFATYLAVWTRSLSFGARASILAVGVAAFLLATGVASAVLLLTAFLLPTGGPLIFVGVLLAAQWLFYFLFLRLGIKRWIKQAKPTIGPRLDNSTAAAALAQAVRSAERLRLTSAKASFAASSLGTAPRPRSLVEVKGVGPRPGMHKAIRALICAAVAVLVCIVAVLIQRHILQGQISNALTGLVGTLAAFITWWATRVR